MRCRLRSHGRGRRRERISPRAETGRAVPGAQREPAGRFRAPARRLAATGGSEWAAVGREPLYRTPRGIGRRGEPRLRAWVRGFSPRRHQLVTTSASGPAPCERSRRVRAPLWWTTARRLTVHHVLGAAERHHGHLLSIAQTGHQLDWSRGLRGRGALRLVVSGVRAHCARAGAPTRGRASPASLPWDWAERAQASRRIRSAQLSHGGLNDARDSECDVARARSFGPHARQSAGRFPRTRQGEPSEPEPRRLREGTLKRSKGPVRIIGSAVAVSVARTRAVTCEPISVVG